jgi:hypothetical protein
MGKSIIDPHRKKAYESYVGQLERATYVRVGLEHPDVADASLAPGFRQSLVNKVILIVGAENLRKNMNMK